MIIKQRLNYAVYEYLEFRLHIKLKEAIDWNVRNKLWNILNIHHSFEEWYDNA
jgi:hypothetical protein